MLPSPYVYRLDDYKLKCISLLWRTLFVHVYPGAAPWQRGHFPAFDPPPLHSKVVRNIHNVKEK